MSMSMNPESTSSSGGLSHSASLDDSSSAATLMTHQHNVKLPDGFTSSRPSSNYNRQYSTLPSSVSVPTFPSGVRTGTSSPDEQSLNGDQVPKIYRSSQSKIESLKNWSISTYKCTKQMMFEKLGKTSRTVDTELEARIEHLREMKRKYLQVLGLSRAFTSHFYNVTQTQQALAEVFSDLAQKSPELQQEFLVNADTQRNLHKNGEVLLSALNFFLSSVNTLCNKTIEDTILTIRQYETSRVEYDAYRSELELMLQLPKSVTSAAKIEEAQRNFNIFKQSYEKLRDDVNVKLQFLDENRIKVMHKQLLLFHNAISAYFSGNQQGLESTLKQFSIKSKSPNTSTASWLEQ